MIYIVWFGWNYYERFSFIFTRVVIWRSVTPISRISSDDVTRNPVVKNFDRREVPIFRYFEVEEIPIPMTYRNIFVWIS